MWSPTHCSVTVQRARGLLTKGKNGTNNCFVTIALGKEKYQTSVKDKSETSVNWNEECELKIPDQGNRAELTLTCLHRNNLGIDEFLGQVTQPLKDMDVYDRPRAKWYKLESKPGKEKKNKERGELEVRIAFVVKSGSLTDLSKKDKHKSSIGQLASSVGGSLLSIGQGEKRKSIKKLAGSLSSKLHIRSKKKHAQVDGDDNSSFSGSFASIGTPNSSTAAQRRRGQRADDADPGVISEDEDEFVFDNLSHKSSGSSLNIQRSGLQPPTPNFAPRNPSPLLGNGKQQPSQQPYNVKLNGVNGGKPKLQEAVDEVASNPIAAEMEQLELDFSVRARTLPPPSAPASATATAPAVAAPAAAAAAPSKPPRTQSSAADLANEEDEWESKLYAGGKYLDIGSSDSLKRRSWERVPLPPTSELPEEQPPAVKAETPPPAAPPAVPPAAPLAAPPAALLATPPVALEASSASVSPSSTDSDSEEEQPAPPAAAPPISIKTPSPRSSSLFSPEVPQRNFDEFNASFAKFEQRNSTAIFDDEKAVREVSPRPKSMPAPLPKPRVSNSERELELERERERERERARQLEEEVETARLRAEEDARLEAELRLNEQRLREEEEAMQRELELEEQRKREAKRREEDQRLLSFAKRSTSLEEPAQAPQQAMEHNFLTPEQSPKEFASNGGGSGSREKRLGKFKYGNKRDKHNDHDSNSPSPKSTERIIIGHEKAGSHAERRSEISAQLAKKYEGKSREELMLIANGMENEALLQRQRVKELEDYLDNLLLRVMETHPKILQNPYSRTTSAKSG